MSPLRGLDHPPVQPGVAQGAGGGLVGAVTDGEPGRGLVFMCLLPLPRASSSSFGAELVVASRLSRASARRARRRQHADVICEEVGEALDSMYTWSSGGGRALCPRQLDSGLACR